MRIAHSTNSESPTLVAVNSMTKDLGRRLFAEFLGSAFLAIVVIGSGIAAQRLSPSDIGLELFENAAATAVGLFAIIVMFGPVSGGHFNPVVSFVDAAFGGLSWRDVSSYVPAQVGGCTVGAIIANLMFALPAVSLSSKHRASGAHFLAEVVATVGLLLVIFALARQPRIGRTGGGWRVHRWRVLLHEFDELCESRHRGGTDVLEHLRWHCTVIGSGLRRCRDLGRHRCRRDHQDPLPARHIS